MWDKEYVPTELAMGVFVMIYKKGAPDNFSNYRCICLLNHAYKILSVVLMKRIVKECKKFLSDWQAGFRATRGCRDNIFILRALYDFVVTGDLKCIITFIDYKAAFDSVSHKFIDKVLKKAKVSRKCRAIFRAIYEAASGKVRVNGTLGKKILSEPFDIQRGVVQGDIVSPVLFILALDLLIQTYDSDEEDSDEGGRKWTARTRSYFKPIQKNILCMDGFEFSVQASRDHYCTPRNDQGPYTVGYPTSNVGRPVATIPRHQCTSDLRDDPPPCTSTFRHKL